MLRNESQHSLLTLSLRLLCLLAGLDRLVGSFVHQAQVISDFNNSGACVNNNDFYYSVSFQFLCRGLQLQSDEARSSFVKLARHFQTLCTIL